MQKRWQNGSANHNVGKAVSGASAQALPIALRTLNIVWDVCSLLDAGKCSYPDDGDRIGGHFERKLELQLRRERLGIAIIDDVEIGDNAENTLLLLHLDLLGSDLLGGINNIYRGLHLCDLESAVSQDYTLSWLEDDLGRGPVRKSLGADGDVIGGSRLEILELKESVVVCLDCSVIAGDRTFKNDPGTRNGIVMV